MDINTQTLILYIRTGLAVLSARLVVLLAMLLTAAMYAAALTFPSWERIAAATLFGILVFLPATRIDAAQSASRAVITPKESS